MHIPDDDLTKPKCAKLFDEVSGVRSRLREPRGDELFDADGVGRREDM